MLNVYFWSGVWSWDEDVLEGMRRYKYHKGLSQSLRGVRLRQCKRPDTFTCRKVSASLHGTPRSFIYGVIVSSRMGASS